MLKSPIRVVAVSYVNTFPFLHGIGKDPLLNDAIDLKLAIPSECARMMLEGEADLGLVPVAAVPQLDGAKVITDFCIGANGAVDTVCLFSEVPTTEVDEILLDFHSRTSVLLIRVLAERHFNIRPVWTPASDGFIDRIKGRTAGVVIGDRAFALRNRFPVVIDLADAWKELTGLPFVFACWVARVPLPQTFIDRFNAALRDGVEHREQAVRDRTVGDSTKMVTYVRDRISYDFNDEKRQAMQLFLMWAGKVSG